MSCHVSANRYSTKTASDRQTQLLKMLNVMTIIVSRMTSHCVDTVQMRGESERGDKKVRREDDGRRWRERGAVVTCDGRLFHRRATATGNALSLTVDRRVRRTSSVGIWIVWLLSVPPQIPWFCPSPKFVHRKKNYEWLRACFMQSQVYIANLVVPRS